MRPTLILLVITALVIGSAGAAQAQTTDVEVEPIACWWRPSTASVRVGEPFAVVLTCAVVETAATKIVPDQSRLDPAVVQLPPFEVIGGAHGSDVRMVGRRFFQYTYQLRLVAENLFGAEAIVPPVQISYRVETRAGQGEATQGRDLTYQLPALTMRVTTLVPDSTRDIREAPAVPLQEIDGMRLRANTLRLLGGLLMAVGGLFVIAALIRLLRRRRALSSADAATLPARDVLRGVRRTLADARNEGQQIGWSSESAGKALAALRIAASYALDRPVAQRALGKDRSPLEGQVIVGGGLFGRAVTSVSGGATTEALSQALAKTKVHGNQLTLEELRDALGGLTAARYGRDDAGRNASIDEAVAGGVRATERLASEYTWIAEMRRAVANWLTSTTSRVWKR